MKLFVHFCLFLWQCLAAVSESSESSTSSSTYGFKAEVVRLMDIIVNSLYTNKDIFLRELVSNSADALEKARLLSLTRNGDGAIDREEYKIDIFLDKHKNEISIEDNGVGMTRQELIDRLGTIANSGTAGLSKESANLIGQFGVGFYSAFLVADKVVVLSKSLEAKNESSHIWECDSRDGKFSVAAYRLNDQEINSNFISVSDLQSTHGTKIILKLKMDSKKYLKKSDVENILKRYSQYIQYPIHIKMTGNTEEKERVSTIGNIEPIWLIDKSKLNETDYNKFYKTMAMDYSDPLSYIHFKGEGDINFNSILYIPSHNKELQTVLSSAEHRISNIKIYVRRILISDNLESFLPRWLSFIKGIIDSDEFPLKIDREDFSETKIIKSVKNIIVKKFFELMKKLSKGFDQESEEWEAFSKNVTQMFKDKIIDDKERTEQTRDINKKFPKYSKYMNIWTRFGQGLVLGCSEDASTEDKRKIAGLMRFTSSKSDGYLTSFDQYIQRMKKGQSKIYFLTGSSYESLMNSPYLELFLKNDVEVVFLLQVLEENCVGALQKYKELPLQTIEKNDVKPGELEFSGEMKDDVALKFEAMKILYKDFLGWIQEYLGDLKAQFVLLSSTLVTSPGMISAPQYGLTANNERLMRASALVNSFEVEAYSAMKNFELNPEHPFVYHMLQKFHDMEKGGDSQMKLRNELEEQTDLLYEASLIASGYPPRRPKLVTQKLYAGMGGTETTNNGIQISDDIWEEARMAMKSKNKKSKENRELDGDRESDDEDDEDSDDVADQKRRREVYENLEAQGIDLEDYREMMRKQLNLDGEAENVEAWDRDEL